MHSEYGGDIIGFRPIERKRLARRELPQTIIILVWIIRGTRKYDRAVTPPRENCFFARGPLKIPVNRSADYQTMKNCYTSRN